ncbi:3-hydroxyacyl-CoA dehydrogenase NAD-binding domain-containing protein [beta proteobacterium MWH-UniP1]
MSHKVLVVLGGGTMGVDIAASFAVYGWKTIVVNPPDERGKTISERFNAALTRLKKTADVPLSVVQSMADVPWSSVDLVIEAVPEKLDLKRQIFAELDRLAPANIPLCSNSSALPISAIAQGLKTEPRMVGTHYFMPAHLVPGVEVVCSEKTDVAVADQVAAYMRSVGKVPIRVKKDLPGFLVNRLQHAVSREAMKLIDRGIATAEDIDAAVRFGFGFRYLAAGPCMQRDHAGLDIHLAAGVSIYPDLCNDAVPSEILTNLVAQGAVGMKAGRGFYEWTPETMAAERKRYEDLLTAASELLASEIAAKK